MRITNYLSITLWVFLLITNGEVIGQIYEHDTIFPEIYIWPGDSIGPGSESLNIEENIIVRALSGSCTRDWAFEKITKPTITPMIPANPNGSAVIVCPGGAYVRVVYDVEGIGVGQWLNSIGIAAFILKYRLPVDAHIDKQYVPLQDAQRAIRYVRKNASVWGLDTSKIGISGASAGGHVATTLATSYNKEVYPAMDTIDSISAYPDFMFLLYPVVSMETDITHLASRACLIGDNPSQELIDEFSAEKHVTSTFPKTFLTRAQDDNAVSYENCLRLYNALVDSGVVTELKVFENGGHGRGICKAVGYDFANWPYYCTNWLKSIGMTEDSVIITSADNHVINLQAFTIYPNPVTSESKLNFHIDNNSNVRISVFDITGRQIKVLLNEKKNAGDYQLPLKNLYNQLQGLYILKFENNNNSISQKVIF